MTNEIQLYDVVDGEILNDYDAPEWDEGVHSGDFHDIPAGRHSPVIGAHELAEDTAWNDRIERRRKSSAWATPLLLIGAGMWLYVAVMFGVTRFEWTGAYFIFALKTLGIGALGTWVFFSGAGRMAG